MPSSKFCSFHDHQECADRQLNKFCECDCHIEEGWVDANLIKWKMVILPRTRTTVVDVWFKDKLGGREWPWRIGVWSAVKMMGLPLPGKVNPLSAIHPAQVIGKLKGGTVYEIKLGGYRTSMRKSSDTELRVQYVRVKKKVDIRGE